MCLGSSPREWGTPRYDLCRRSIRRFIPTRVGNTRCRIYPRYGRTVHPHASGEHTYGQLNPHPAVGSSPREWGTPRSLNNSIPNSRFIPTRVGNTYLIVIAPTVSSVHPHASGEHGIWIKSLPITFGSSPREWGTHPEQKRGMCTHPVHPHASGEHGCVMNQSRSDMGSSPREWGTRRGRNRNRSIGRFIPTRVGNTMFRRP